MCKFVSRARLCGCEDPCCKQRSGPLNSALKEPGHISQMFEYRRVSGICPDWFPNHDPNRLVRCYGIAPDAMNSTQDCRSATKDLQIKDDTVRDLQMCDKCLQSCTQPEISPSVLEDICTKLIAASAERDEKNHKKARIAAMADGLKFREDPEDVKRRYQRDDFRATLAIPEIRRREGSLKDFDVVRLLHPGEKSAVYELARQRTADLPRKRKAAAQEKKLGLVYYRRHFDEEEKEFRARELEKRKKKMEGDRLSREAKHAADVEKQIARYVERIEEWEKTSERGRTRTRSL